MSYIEAAIDAVVKGNESALLSVLNRGLEIGADLVNIVDEGGMTLLMHAAASPQSEMLVPLLLLKGADMNIQDYQNRIALHYHAAYGRIYGLSCLLYQSNIHVDHMCNDSNCTPYAYAVRFKQNEAAKLLIAYGAKQPVFDDAGKSEKFPNLPKKANSRTTPS